MSGPLPIRIRLFFVTAIAVCEIEASALLNRLELPGYQRASLLIRYHGRAVGHGEVAVTAGRVGVRNLRQAIVDQGGWMIAHRRVEELLNVEPVSVEPPRCTVSVCTRDRPDDLAQCLEALMALPDEGQEFLVIDRASKSPATRDLVGLAIPVSATSVKSDPGSTGHAIEPFAKRSTRSSPIPTTTPCPTPSGSAR